MSEFITEYPQFFTATILDKQKQLKPDPDNYRDKDINYICFMKQKTIITEQDFIDAEDEYINLSDKQVERLAWGSAKEQPALFVFVATYYDGVTEKESKNIFLQLIYSTWIAYKKKYKLNRVLSIGEIEDMDAEEEKLLSGMHENEDEIMKEAFKRLTRHPQHELIGHLYEAIGDFFQLDDPDTENDSENDAGIISAAMTLFVNLMEKARQGPSGFKKTN